MVESSLCNVAAVGGGYWRTSLQNEHRSSHGGLKNRFRGSPSRIQISTCKLRSSCNSLRLGAAEEGVSSWEDKLESTTTGHVTGESDTAWRDRIVDEEGNIDNIEQELIRSPCEDEAVSEQQPDDRRASANEKNDNSPQQNTLTQVTDASLSSTSNLWPKEDGIKEGDKGEAIVENAHVSPSCRDGEVSPMQFQVDKKFGSSEASCDEGSLSRTNLHDHEGGKAMQVWKLEEEEEEVFQEDGGRTPDDYQRRANLFGKSGEQFAAQKQRDEKKND